MTHSHFTLEATGAGVTELPDDPAVAELADHGRDRFLDVVCAHPGSSLCWALLAEGSLNMGSRDGDVAAYAYARTGYHRGLDQLRRYGWKGQGAIPWEHEPNRGFLKALWALTVAAHRIGETAEFERCVRFLRDSSETAYRVLSSERPIDDLDEQEAAVLSDAAERDIDSPLTGPQRETLEAEVAKEDVPSDAVLTGPRGEAGPRDAGARDAGVGDAGARDEEQEPADDPGEDEPDEDEPDEETEDTESTRRVERSGDAGVVPHVGSIGGSEDFGDDPSQRPGSPDPYAGIVTGEPE